MWIVVPLGSDRSIYGLPRFTLAAMVACTLVYMWCLLGDATEVLDLFGYAPTEGLSAGLVLHMFMHGGFLHLAGNMLFLWSMGVNVEQRWGSVTFAAIYLLGGVVGALTFAALHRGSDIPLVGASGAISTAMGAFLVTLHSSRIRLFYFFFPLRPGTFQIPAYVLLPFWFLVDLSLMQLETGRGTAYSAHVAGFAFGVLAAGALKLTGLEKRLLDKTGADAFDDPTKWTTLPPGNAPAPANPLRCAGCGLMNMPDASACRRCRSSLDHSGALPKARDSSAVSLK